MGLAAKNELKRPNQQGGFKQMKIRITSIAAGVALTAIAGFAVLANPGTAAHAKTLVYCSEANPEGF